MPVLTTWISREKNIQILLTFIILLRLRVMIVTTCKIAKIGQK